MPPAWLCGASNPRQRPLSSASAYFSRALGPSLPLDRARWLGGDVVGDAIHAGNLVDDAARDPFEHLVWQARPVRGHGVVARDSPNHDRVGVSALVSHHAD